MLNINEIIVRKSEYDDIENLVELSKEGFPGMDSFKSDHFQSHLDIFPEGQYCIEYKNKIIGSCSSMILNFNKFSSNANFDEVTKEGYISNHDSKGSNLYGVDVVIHPDYRKMKLGSRLYEIRKNICKSLNLKSIIFGGRIPNYYLYEKEMSVEKYVSEVKKSNIYDPTLTFQLNKEFKLKDIIPNYLPDDKESMKYAILLEWENPYYVIFNNI